MAWTAINQKSKFINEIRYMPVTEVDVIEGVSVSVRCTAAILMREALRRENEG